MDRTRLPFRLWPLVHVIYEWAMVINMVVTLAFWLMEAPFMIYFYWWSSYTDLATNFALYYSHLVPMTLMLTDWYHCSIRISFKRVWLHLMFAAIYTVILIYATLYWTGYGSVVYQSMDFYRRPKLAGILLFVLTSSVVPILYCWACITSKRLGCSKQQVPVIQI